MVAVAALLFIVKGPVEAGQATLTGLVAASYFALGAVGLTLVFGILRLVNFAHGDLLTVGAYVTLGIAAAGLPFWAAATLAVAVTALIAAGLDRLVWAPLRRAGTSTLQAFLVAIGLAWILRYTVQFFAGSQVRAVGLDTTSAIDIGPWHLGTLQLLAMLVGLAIIALTGLALRYTRLGKAMRALADNMALAEASGIDT